METGRPMSQSIGKSRPTSDGRRSGRSGPGLIHGTQVGAARRSSILLDGRRGFGIVPERRCGGGSTASVADDAVPGLGGGGEWCGRVPGRKLLTRFGTDREAVGGAWRPRGGGTRMGHAKKGAERGRLLVDDCLDRAGGRASGRVGELEGPAREWP